MQQSVNALWIAVPIILTIIAISIFLPLVGDTNKAFLHTGSENKPYIENTEIPVPVGVNSSEIIASLRYISIDDFAIEVKQAGSTYLFRNDANIEAHINSIHRNSKFEKTIHRDSTGKVTKVTYTEMTS